MKLLEIALTLLGIVSFILCLYLLLVYDSEATCPERCRQFNLHVLSAVPGKATAKKLEGCICGEKGNE